MQPLALGGRDDRPTALRENHKQAVVLSGVMPRTPKNVEGKDPRKKTRRSMHQNARGENQKGDVQRDEFVFVEVFARVVRAVNRGHEVRVIKDYREKIKGNSPGVRVGGGHEQRHRQQGRRPGSATYSEVEPRPIYPRSRGDR